MRESSSEEKPCQLVLIWCHLKPCPQSMVILVLELVLLLVRAVMEARLLPVIAYIASRCIRYAGDVSVTLNLLLDISHHDKPVMVYIPPFLLGKRGSRTSEKIVVKIAYPLLPLVFDKVLSYLGKGIV